MQISQSALKKTPTAARPPAPSSPTLGTQDTFAPDESNRNERVLGTTLAGAGAIVGRFGTVVGAAMGGAAVGSVLGPVGSVAGGILGVAAGAAVEFRDKYFKGIEIAGKRWPIGRMVGGFVGGVTGAVIGKVLDRLPFGKPKLGSDSFNHTARDFSVKKLVSNLSNVKHTSHQTMDEAGKTDEILELLKPGDVVMTNNDSWMDFEIPLKLVAVGGDWTHTALYAGEGKTIEALGSRGVVERPARELVGENHHVRVLRPEYPEGGVEKAITEAASHVGKPYDLGFSLDSDDKMYCIEHTAKALEAGNPDIDLETHRLIAGKAGWEFVSPKVFNRSGDFEVVYDTGSKFSQNYMSKFA